MCKGDMNRFVLDSTKFPARKVDAVLVPNAIRELPSESKPQHNLALSKRTFQMIVDGLDSTNQIETA
jgi:hypothetical protein